MHINYMYLVFVKSNYENLDFSEKHNLGAAVV